MRAEGGEGVAYMEKRAKPWNPKNLEKPCSHEKVYLPLRHDVAEFKHDGAD